MKTTTSSGLGYVVSTGDTWYASSRALTGDSRVLSDPERRTGTVAATTCSGQTPNSLKQSRGRSHTQVMTACGQKHICMPAHQLDVVLQEYGPGSW